jgi:hypothetical protein
MNYIKKNRNMIILSSVIGITILLILYMFYMLFFRSNGSTMYGNRLEGIKDYPLTTEFSVMKENLLETEKVIKVTNNLKGKIINIMITVNDDITIDLAKELEVIVIESYTEDQKSFYDIQIYLISNNEEQFGYPSIGYKHHTSEKVVWTNNDIQVVE